jgi:hypothetical protein
MVEGHNKTQHNKTQHNKTQHNKTQQAARTVGVEVSEQLDR